MIYPFLLDVYTENTHHISCSSFPTDKSQNPSDSELKKEKNKESFHVQFYVIVI